MTAPKKKPAPKRDFLMIEMIDNSRAIIAKAARAVGMKLSTWGRREMILAARRQDAELLALTKKKR